MHTTECRILKISPDSPGAGRMLITGIYSDCSAEKFTNQTTKLLIRQVNGNSIEVQVKIEEQFPSGSYREKFSTLVLTAPQVRDLIGQLHGCIEGAG